MARERTMWFKVFVLVLCGTLVTSQGDVTLGDNGVQELILPMCKNLVPYTHTKLPNVFNHSTQVEVYKYVQYQWAYMDYGCSVNFRLFVCSLYAPMYDQDTGEVIGPCKETCNKARGRCRSAMEQTQSRWPRQWRCNAFPSRRARNTKCLKPLREPRPNSQLQYLYCSNITLTQCQGIPYTLGSLPNLFLQRNMTELEVEMNYYERLLRTGCSEHLRIFLCGTYVPFCAHTEAPFMIPCRELCTEVHDACHAHFSVIYGGLPWPSKLQCYRYPAADTASRGQCFMPGDVYLNLAR